MPKQSPEFSSCRIESHPLTRTSPCEALSYERLRFLFRDAFGLIVSEGALMNMFIRSHAGFKIEANKAKAILRKAKVVASDETGVRIEGTNSYH
jgi:transposase